MAKRRVVYRTKARKVYRRSRGGGGGFKPVIDGLIAGVAGQFAGKYIGGYGHPAASIAVGMWRKNTVLQTEGARELGAQLAANLPFVGGTSPYAGGGY